MHRTLMAGMSLLALAAVAGCADNSGMATSNAGSAGFGRTQAACPPGNMDPSCPDRSRLGTAGTSRPDRGDTTMYGSSDNPAFGVQPQNRRNSAGNAPGAGMPAEMDNRRPSEVPSTLSGDSGKRTSSGPGGN